MMAGGRPWTLEEIEAVRHLPAGGLAELVQKLGRSRSAINQKRVKCGFAQSRPNWTRKEVETLDCLVNEGVRVEDAAAQIGRSRGGAYGRRNREREAGAVVALARSHGRTYR